MNLDAARRDLRLALRSLLRTPAFAIGTFAILTLAIGSSTTMFSLYKAIVVEKLPVLDQDNLVVMHPLDRGGTRLDAPYPYLADIARDSTVFRAVTGVYHLTGVPAPYIDGDRAIPINALSASANFFSVLGLRPLIGRVFRSEDGVKGAPFVIVLTYDGWQRRFGGDTGVIGRKIKMPYTEQPVEIVGVTPPGFTYPANIEAWMPIPPDFTGQVDIIVRLAPHVSIATAKTALLQLTARSNPFLTIANLPNGPRDPSQFQILGMEAHSLAEMVLGNSRSVMLALSAAVALLLLIACVNVGNLALVRALGRTREIAVRRALGATFGDIARLFLIENGLLAVTGGVAGLAIAIALLHVVKMKAPAELPRADAIAVGAPAVGIAVTVTVVALLLFGLAPSLVASRANSYVALRADVRSGAEGKERRRARRWLVSFQVALAVMLLAGAGLLVRTLTRLEAMNLGYRVEHLSILVFSGPQSTLSSQEKIADAGKSLVAHFEVTPGVVAATEIENTPFEGQSLYIMKVAPANTPTAERNRYGFTPFEFVGPGYFRTFDIPIRRGRGFTASDTKGADNVVVVSETLAERMWPHDNAVGKQLVQVVNNSSWTVVGVASDTHLRELKNGGPVVYFNGDQVTPFWNGLVAVRTTAPIARMLPALRKATDDVGVRLILWDVKTMDELLSKPMALPRMSALLLSGFSVVALLLSVVGLYGAMSSTVRQQTRDIGVRLALGATARDIRDLVLSDAVRVVGIGTALGIVGAVLGGRLLSSQLFGVNAVDPLSLGLTTIFLFGAAGVAAWIPARRAARIDPVQALRGE